MWRSSGDNWGRASRFTNEELRHAAVSVSVGDGARSDVFKRQCLSYTRKNRVSSSNFRGHPFITDKGTLSEVRKERKGSRGDPQMRQIVRI